MHPRYLSLLLTVVLCISIARPTIEPNHRASPIHSSLRSSEFYTVHEVIDIESDQDFIDLGFPGNGSVENPFRLEGLNITSSVPYGMAIAVQNTHVFFIVQDCLIVSEYIGVALLDIATGTGRIVNNTLISSSGDGGAILIETVNCTILENRCANWGQGIHLNEASHCTISRNNISDSTYQGINIRYSDNNTITGNRITNSTQHGLAFVGTSSWNIAYNNTFIDNGSVDEYEIDGERHGTLASQGYDEGSYNSWYYAVSKTGNYWSDYSGVGSYAIDGPADSVDLYPTGSQPPSPFAIITILAICGLTVVFLMMGIRKLAGSEKPGESERGI